MHQLKLITGTPNYIITRRNADESVTLIVAEVVKVHDGYAIYRMDATGVIASGIASPEDALAAFTEWTLHTGISPSPVRAT